MENMPSNNLVLQPKWAELTLKQLQKDANMSGVHWLEGELPTAYQAWINLIHENLLLMEKQNPEYLVRFLYRVDLPEKHFLQSPFPSEAMAEAILKREFLKVWFKAQYRP